MYDKHVGEGGQLLPYMGYIGILAPKEKYF